MSDEAVDVVDRIVASFRRLTSDSTFAGWLASEKGSDPNDLIIANNSFVYREGVPTNKSADYLCIRRADVESFSEETIGVCRPASFNNDFKYFSALSGNLPTVSPVASCIESKLESMGQLVFVLVSPIDDTIGVSTGVKHSMFGEMRFDPVSPTLVSIEGSSIVVSSLSDPESTWLELEDAARKSGKIDDSLPRDLESPFAVAFDALQHQAYSVVRLFEQGESAETILLRIVRSVGAEVASYDRALDRCQGEFQRDPQSFSDVLRIAYNFASNLGKVLSLIISICDLKPLLLWGTIYEHFALAQEFRQLPWAKSNKKASLSRYRDIISGARNHAFHDMISLDRSIEVDLEGVSLQARRMRIFSPYARKLSGNYLEYQDQELAELLGQFTRAPELAVPPAFWRRNSRVMHAFYDLLLASNCALSSVRMARRN